MPAGRSDRPEPEVVRRLMFGGEVLPGSFLLRRGEFVELGEAIEWRAVPGAGKYD